MEATKDIRLSSVRTGPFVTQTIGILVVVALGIGLARVIPDVVHRFMPAHRTITHDLIFWMVAGLASVIVIRRMLVIIQADAFLETYLPIAIALPVFLGVVTHVSADTVKNYVRDYAPAPLTQQAKRVAPWVPKHKPVIADIPQLARILLDSRAPTTIRIFVLVTAVYGLIPLDLISDFIPIIGWTDDLGIYLSLRSTVYSGCQNDESVVETGRRTVATILKVYIPTLLLSIAALGLTYILVLR